MCETAQDIFLKNQILISDENTIITDILRGYVRCSSDLALLDFGNVIIRRDHLQMDKVKILTGGPSGHEPSYPGFVGKGFLTATVQGDIYCTPPPQIILHAIKELSRRNIHGVLIIVGDSLCNRINFSLAIEKAIKFPNVQVKTIFVKDEERGCLGNRSSVGTLLIQKIASAMAEIGFFLGEIYEFCQSVLKDILTISVVIESATNPWAKINTAFQPSTGKIMTFGAGNHGQPGYLKMPLKSTEETVRIMLEQIRFPEATDIIDIVEEQEETPVKDKVKDKDNDKSKNKDNDKAKNKAKDKGKGKKTKDSSPDKEIEEEHVTTPVILVINNLGNASKYEERLFTQEVILQLQMSKTDIAKVLVGTFMTSLRMSGFTITLMKLYNSKVIDYISYPCSIPVWQEFVPLKPEVELFISTALQPNELRPRVKRGPELSVKDEKIIKTAILFACEAVIINEKQLNSMDDEFKPTYPGTNLRKICSSILAAVDTTKNLNYPYELFRELADVQLKNNYNSMVNLYLYCIMLQKAANVFMSKSKDDIIDSRVWLEVLKGCAFVLLRYSKTKFGAKTMYDPLFICSNQFETSLNNGLDGLTSFHIGIQAAESDVRLVQSRGSDPEAYAVALWLRAIYNGIINCQKETS